VIVSVNGESTTDWSVDQAVSKIRGPHGTEVTLTIYHQGDSKTQDIKITRQKIEVKSVKLEYKQQDGKKIAIISMSVFGTDTKALFDKAVNDVITSGAKGLVLDLRNNPGGYLEAAVDSASQWIEKDKLVVTEAHSEKSSIPYNSFGYKRLAGVKTVVLINGGSASASEILAGALQDYKIAALIGEKSFGKGSVQELIDLPGDTAVKVTVAKWILPNGRNLNKDGLNPDIEVKISDDDIKNQRDPQLDRALLEAAK
jgi:carboxyl-terminal processing protease